MYDLLTSLFDTSGFPARWRCGSGWEDAPWIGWLHILSDLGIWSAYLAIPCVLGYFALRRRDIPFRSIFWLFGAFILACGSTHLMEAALFWWPAYRFAGVIKLITALVSWGTVVALIPVVPKVLAMRSAEELEAEVAQRRRAESMLLDARADLEKQVRERTAALHFSEERFRLFVEGIQGYGIYMLDPQGHVSSWNTGAEKIKGYRSDEVIGTHFARFYTAEEAASGAPEHNLNVAVRTGSYEGEGWRARKDGSRFWASVVITALRSSAGDLCGFCKVTRDLTERKHSEDRLRSVVPATPYRTPIHEFALSGRRNSLVRGCGVTSIVIGCLVLLGWLFDIPLLKSALPGLATMKANTALLCVVAGISLWGLHPGSQLNRCWHRVGLICAMAVAAIALLTLGEYTTGLDPRLDELVFIDTAGSVGLSSPGRMAPATAFLGLLIGAALCLLHGGVRPLLAQGLATLAFAGSFLALTGYLFGADSLHAVAGYGSVALHTAIALTILAVGILAGCPNRGMVGLIASGGVGGILVRRILPAALCFPLLLGYVQLAGERAGLYGTEFGLAIFALSNIFVFTGIIVWNAGRLEKLESERLAALESQQHSEAQFRQLADSIPQLAWAARPDGHIYWYNQRWYDYTGTTPEQMDGWGWQSVHDPAVLPRVMEQWRASIATGKPFEMEFPLRGADGRFRSFLTRIVPTRNTGGQVLQWFGTNTDITERKQAEEKLEASERIYRAIGESIDYGVWVCDAEGKNLYISPSFLHLVGITQEECSGFGWGKHLFAADADRTIAAWKECVRVQGKWNIEHRFLGVDKHWYPILSRGVPVRDERGEITAWAGINLDISGLKQAEESLQNLNASLEQQVAERTAAAEDRAIALARSEGVLREQTQLMESILHSMSEGVVVADQNGRFLIFNPAAEAILGMGLTEALPNAWSDVYGLFYPDTTTTFPAEDLPLARAMRGEPTDDCELFIRNAQRTSGCRIVATGRPLLTEQGTVRGGVAVFRDITARKQAEVQIMASLEEKQVLLQEIHHRVKNNLQVISSLLDLQSQYSKDETTIELFRESQNRVRSMALVHEHLYQSETLANIDFGEYMQKLVGHLSNSYSVAGNNGAVRFDLDLEPLRLGIDTAVPCGLVINELVSNCLKYAFPNHPGVVSIRLAQEGEVVVLTVRDDGVGLPEHVTFDNPKSFGLRLVRALVSQLHGDARIDRSGGSTIQITFPASRKTDGKESCNADEPQ